MLKRKIAMYICSFFTFLFLLVFLPGSQAISGVCTDLLKSECGKKSNCSWVKGYENDRGERVQGYCRKKTKSRHTSKPPKKRKKDISANLCRDLRKADCEKKRKCNWVKGYTSDSSERIKGYCRRQAAETTGKKRKGKAQSCSAMRKIDCEKSRNCSWIKGYTSDGGEKVKSYCRKKARESKATRPADGKKKSANICSDLRMADCGKKRNCSWVKGYTNDNGERIKGYCRKKSSSTKLKKREKSDSKKQNDMLEVLQDLLKSKK